MAAKETKILTTKKHSVAEPQPKPLTIEATKEPEEVKSNQPQKPQSCAEDSRRFLSILEAISKML
jgi:hypothetical protein